MTSPFLPFQTPSHVPDLNTNTRSFDDTDSITDESVLSIDTPISTLYNVQIGLVNDTCVHVMYDGKPVGYGFDDIVSRGGKLIGIRNRDERVSKHSLRSEKIEWVIDKFGILLTDAVNGEIEFTGGGTRYTDDPPFMHSTIPYVPLVPSSDTICDGDYSATYHTVTFRHADGEWIVYPKSGTPVTATRFYLSPVLFSPHHGSMFDVLAELETQEIMEQKLSVNSVTKTTYQERKFVLVNIRTGTTNKYDSYKNRVGFESYGSLLSPIIMSREYASKIPMLNK